MEATTNEGRNLEEQAAKKKVLIINERFTWPWKIYIYQWGGRKKRLPLRLYPLVIMFYLKMVHGKLSRSVRSCLRGLTQHGKYRIHVLSNTRNSKKDERPANNPYREV